MLHSPECIGQELWMAMSDAEQGQVIRIFRHLQTRRKVLELLVAEFNKKSKSLVELRTEFVVVNGVVISRKSFVTFQIPATNKILYPLHYDSRICFELRLLATIYDLTQWTSGASQTSVDYHNEFKVLIIYSDSTAQRLCSP